MSFARMKTNFFPVCLLSAGRQSDCFDEYTSAMFGFQSRSVNYVKFIEEFKFDSN